MPVPPTIAEQISTFEVLQHEIAPVNTAISRLEREIELLREYKTRLVADVVTGKLDVREAAARFPQDADEATSEPDGLTEAEDTDSDELTELEA